MAEKINLQTQMLAKDLESQYNRKFSIVHILYLSIDSLIPTGDEYRRIKALLDPPDPSEYYLAAKDRRDPDSGVWLMKDTRYDLWRQSPSSLLWIHGIRKSGSIQFIQN